MESKEIFPESERYSEDQIETYSLKSDPVSRSIVLYHRSLKSAESENQKLKEEIELFKKMTIRSGETYNALCAENQKLREENNKQYESEMNTITKNIELVIELQDKDKELDRLREEVYFFKKSVDRINNLNQALESKIKELEEELERLKEGKIETYARCLTLTVENNKLKSRVKELENIKS